MWSYVVTAHKPTNVSYSCVGNFTSPHDLNLIIVKCTRIEIHYLTPHGLQPMMDVPIYGRIATLELFRPQGEQQDFLFIATERYKFCVLQWDAEASELISRHKDWPNPHRHIWHRNGVNGVIASHPHDQYIFLERLQGCLNKVIKGVGGLVHKQWRSFNNEKKVSDARNFLDGDLIKTFLDLSCPKMEEVSKTVNVTLEEFCKRVEELASLH